MRVRAHEQASQHTLLSLILRGWHLLMPQMESFVQVHVGASGVNLEGETIGFAPGFSCVQ